MPVITSVRKVIMITDTGEEIIFTPPELQVGLIRTLDPDTKAPVNLYTITGKVTNQKLLVK